MYAYQVDVYEPGAAALGPAVMCCAVDVGGELRHLFFGNSRDEAETFFHLHLKDDRILAACIAESAAEIEFRRIPWRGDFPTVRHIFYGVDEETAAEKFSDHMIHDAYLRAVVGHSSFRGVPCRVVQSGRIVPVKDKEGFRP